MSKPPDDLSGKRLLVVDDEIDVCEAVMDVLEDLCEVDSATTEAEARRQLSGGSYDGAILDVMGVNGLELLSEFAEELPCVLLTAHSLDAHTLRQAIERGARAFIPKVEAENLPLYLRVALSSVDLDELWAIWLWDPIDLVNLDYHLGSDWDEGEDAQFFRELRERVGARTKSTTEIQGNVAVITHFNPPLNLLSPSVCVSLYRLMQQMKEDERVEAVILRSGLPPDYPPKAVSQAAKQLPLNLGRTWLGRLLAKLLLRIRYPGIHRSRTFGAGLALECFENPTMMEVTQRFGLEVYLGIYEFPKPFLMLAEGLAFAGGFELLLCSHYVLATRCAMVSLPEFNLAFPPPAGIPLLANRVGPQRAFCLAADTRTMDAQEAHRVGIIDQLVPTGSAMKEALRQARSMARRQTVKSLQQVRRLLGYDMRHEVYRGFDAWRQLSAAPEAQRRLKRFLARSRMSD